VHEYSLVEALVRRVEEEARRRQATRIHGLRVRIGALAGVEAGLFRTAYETFRQGTLCEGAPLEIVESPAGWACPRCGEDIAPGAVLRCAACGVPARLAEGADALLLDAIDMEVP
jgi:hydrogenase nickel incorporation protein HypA/HybF